MTFLNCVLPILLAFTVIAIIGGRIAWKHGHHAGVHAERIGWQAVRKEVETYRQFFLDAGVRNPTQRFSVGEDHSPDRSWTGENPIESITEPPGVATSWSDIPSPERSR